LIQEHTFQPRDLIAGHLALDLVNTVTARNAEPVDWLTGYAAPTPQTPRQPRCTPPWNCARRCTT
jgi:hypothetical protein